MTTLVRESDGATLGTVQSNIVFSIEATNPMTSFLVSDQATKTIYVNVNDQYFLLYANASDATSPGSNLGTSLSIQAVAGGGIGNPQNPTHGLQKYGTASYELK